MVKYNYSQIRKCVLKWSEGKGKNEINLIKNESDILLFDMGFEKCLAELVVCKPEFAPYKNVSFEAFTTER